ncbi:MAG TPA: hypothetical protein VMW47_08090 [Verrucomicrobiae bacterium]|nr:hypothetical protein [Verrucomicrobiae bacterium]
MRAATQYSDCQLGADDAHRDVRAAGIRSTGMSASMAIAERLRDLLHAMGLPLDPAPGHRSAIKPDLSGRRLRPHRDPDAIARDPDAGWIVCHCEQVTRAECLTACRSPILGRSVDGLRRRTRAMLGRCREFACAAEILALRAEGTGRPVASMWPRR